MKGKLLSTLMTSLREGIAATRIADFINDQLRTVGINNPSTGALLFIEIGGQCTCPTDELKKFCAFNLWVLNFF